MKRNLGQDYYCQPGKMYKRKLLSLIMFVCLTYTHHSYSQSFNTPNSDTEASSKATPSGSSTFSFLGGSEFDTSFIGSGEIWINKWGLSTQLHENESNNAFGLPPDSEYYNLDIKRRFGSKNKSNFELGLGWQELNIDSQLDASGPKVSLGGNLKVLKSFRVYGATSYFPDLDDNIGNSDVSAYEVEAGLLYSPLPSLSLKAGYRVFNLDLDDPEIKALGSSSGFLLGSDWSW